MATPNGNPAGTHLVEGAFETWFADKARTASSPERHDAFKWFRWGFQDGELAVGQASDTDAYQAGWESGWNYHGPERKKGYAASAWTRRRSPSTTAFSRSCSSRGQ
jgi:hypothetical protein